MVIITETEDIKTESEEGALILPWPKKHKLGATSLLFQHRQILSITFLRNNFHGATFKLCQAPEMSRNLMPFSSYSQLMKCLESARSTSNLRKKDSVKMVGWSNNNTEDFHSQISKTLRQLLKKVVTEFRLSTCSNVDEMGNNSNDDVVEAVPISYKAPEDCHFDSNKMDMVLSQSQRKRLTTLVVGETLISFKLPENCSFDPTDVDKLQEPNGSDEMNVRKYNFFQRLEGWKIERRQRFNGRFDMYYYHKQSTRMFRSISEVINFLLYEVYPDKSPKSTGKEKVVGGEDDLSVKNAAKQEAGITPLKRKISPNFARDDDDDDDEISSSKSKEEMHPNIYGVVGDHHHYHEKEAVEKFLADAYDNLMNWPHHHKQIKDTSFIICDSEEETEDNYGNLSPQEETVEELLEEAYNDLLNSPKAKMHQGKKRKRSIEKPKSKESKTFTTSTSPSVSNDSHTKVINTILIEQKEKDKEKEKEKEEEEEEKLNENVTLIPDDNDPKADPSAIESSAATASVVELEDQNQDQIASPVYVKHKRINIREVDGQVIFSEVESEPNHESKSGSGGNASALSSHVDECDLINHIRPQSPDMFELALFLSNTKEQW